MQTIFKAQIERVANMAARERNTLLCQLAVKEHMGTLMPDEMFTLSFIQAVRSANGEIDRVLRNWEDNPELDPRRQ